MAPATADPAPAIAAPAATAAAAAVAAAADGPALVSSASSCAASMSWSFGRIGARLAGAIGRGGFRDGSRGGLHRDRLGGRRGGALQHPGGLVVAVPGLVGVLVVRGGGGGCGEHLGRGLATQGCRRERRRGQPRGGCRRGGCRSRCRRRRRGGSRRGGRSRGQGRRNPRVDGPRRRDRRAARDLARGPRCDLAGEVTRRGRPLVVAEREAAQGVEVARDPGGDLGGRGDASEHLGCEAERRRAGTGPQTGEAGIRQGDDADRVATGGVLGLEVVEARRSRRSWPRPAVGPRRRGCAGRPRDVGRGGADHAGGRTRVRSRPHRRCGGPRRRAARRRGRAWARDRAPDVSASTTQATPRSRPASRTRWSVGVSRPAARRPASRTALARWSLSGRQRTTTERPSVVSSAVHRSHPWRCSILRWVVYRPSRVVPGPTPSNGCPFRSVWRPS